MKPSRILLGTLLLTLALPDPITLNLWNLRLTKRCRDCHLFGARLTHADLSGADLRNADLRWAHLTSVNLNGADLSGANLRNARLYDVTLKDTNLCGATLMDAVKSSVGCRKLSAQGNQ